MFEESFSKKSIKTEEEKKLVELQRTDVAEKEGKRYADYHAAGKAAFYGGEPVEFEGEHHQSSAVEDEAYLLSEQYDAHKKRIEIEFELNAIHDAYTEKAKVQDSVERTLIDSYQNVVERELREQYGVAEELGWQAVDEEVRLKIQEEKMTKVADYLDKNRLFAEPTEQEKEQFENLRERELTLLSEYDDLIDSPEGFYHLEYYKLKQYKESAAKGEIIEVPSVKQKADELYQNISIGKPVFLTGDQGSGKTEMARHVAKTRFGATEPYVVSMRHDMDPADYVGRNQIVAKEKIKDDLRENLSLKLADELLKRITKWQEQNPQASDEEKALVSQNLQANVAADYESALDSRVETNFTLGQMYKAMEEGVPFIMDEVNAAPHDILISLNDYLTRRPGDTVRVQQDGGREILIKPGFAFVFTGNVGNKYKRADAKGMDPAFLSRLHTIKYDYPKQVTDVSYNNYLQSQTERNQRPDNEEGAELPVELFEILVAILMDETGTCQLTKEDFEQVFNLAKTSRLLQDNFGGRDGDSAMYGGEGGIPRYELQKAVPSIRNLIAVITDWKQDNFVRPLDYFLYKNFIAQADVETDRVFMTAFFKQYGGFFTNEDMFKESGGLIQQNASGEKLNTNYTLDVSLLEEMRSRELGTQSRASRDLEKHLIDQRKQRSEVMGPTKLVDAVYGKGPSPEYYGVPVGQEPNDEPVETAEAIASETVLVSLLETADDYLSETDSLLEKLSHIETNECVI